ncbi:hypothetical protein [Streptomyces sioyaensis]|uniref:hypothetical protein n=1 Tax=Streptomyces sioyaensis TaxID=67364 RepID=UPI001EEF8F46|nr:hypothetical protein [Streptomyces sioyaensis]
MPEQILTGTVRVAVHSPDAVVHAGLVSSLKHDRRVQEVPPERIHEADAVVAAFDTVDATALDRLRALSDSPDTRFLLVAGRHWRADVSEAIDRGVRAVLWRDTFTPSAFVRTLLTVADGGGSFPPTLQGRWWNRSGGPTGRPLRRAASPTQASAPANSMSSAWSRREKNSPRSQPSCAIRSAP